MAIFSNSNRKVRKASLVDGKAIPHKFVQMKSSTVLISVGLFIGLSYLLTRPRKEKKNDIPRPATLTPEQQAHLRHEQEERIAGWYHRGFLMYAILFATYFLVFSFYVAMFCQKTSSHATELNKPVMESQIHSMLPEGR